MRSEELRVAARLTDGFTFGEALSVLAIIGLSTSFAIRNGMVAIEHVKVSEAIMVSTGPRVAWMERWAVDGTMPGPIPASQVSLSLSAPGGEAPVSRYLETYLPGDRDGGFAFTLSAEAGLPSGQQIGFRAAVGPGEVPATMMWSCGHHPIPRGMRGLGPDRTTLGNADLPSACRG